MYLRFTKFHSSLYQAPPALKNASAVCSPCLVLKKKKKNHKSFFSDHVNNGVIKGTHAAEAKEVFLDPGGIWCTTLPGLWRLPAMASVVEVCLLSTKLALRLALASPPVPPPPASAVFSTVTAAAAGAEDDEEVAEATEG